MGPWVEGVSWRPILVYGTPCGSWSLHVGSEHGTFDILQKGENSHNGSLCVALSP